MENILYRYLANDHKRLDNLLKRARAASPVDLQVYEEFRKGLLRHIFIEEKIAFPAVLQLEGVKSDPDIAQLRLDHGAFAMLLIPMPAPSILATLVSILSIHNGIEEGPGGVYERLEQLAGADSPALLERFKAAPDLPVLALKPLSQVSGSVRRAVRRAGRDFVDVDN